MTDRLIDVAAVARRLSVSCQTVRRWIAEGKIAAVRLPSGYHKVPMSELERLKNCNNSHARP